MFYPGILLTSVFFFLILIAYGLNFMLYIL